MKSATSRSISVPPVRHVVILPYDTDTNLFQGVLMPLSKYISSPKLGASWRDTFLQTCTSADKTTVDMVAKAVEKALYSIVAISGSGERGIDPVEEMVLSLVATDLALFGEAAGNGTFIFDPRDVTYHNGVTHYKRNPYPGAWRVECSSLVYATAWGDSYVEKAFLTQRPAIAEAAIDSMGLVVTWGFPPEPLLG